MSEYKDIMKIKKSNLKTIISIFIFNFIFKNYM